MVPVLGFLLAAVIIEHYACASALSLVLGFDELGVWVVPLSGRLREPPLIFAAPRPLVGGGKNNTHSPALDVRQLYICETFQPLVPAARVDGRVVLNYGNQPGAEVR